MLLRRLIALRQITPPAIWGKLPGHGDFVRSGVKHGESDAWRSWLATHGGQGPGEPSNDLPVAFVLPPASLACAPHRFVVGVIAPSMDRVGRRHPLIVYQMANPGWVHRHFRSHAAQPRDWFYWLARAARAHVRGASGVMTLERAVRALWQVHAPFWPDSANRRRASDRVVAAQLARAQAAFDEWTGRVYPDHEYPELVGVRHMPWVDWPQRLQCEVAETAFWQQDVFGGFVEAAVGLNDIWRRNRRTL